MRFVLLSALKDLRRMRRDPVGLGTWIGIPLLIGLLMVTLFGRGQPKPQGVLLVADQDGTLLSSMLSRAYTQGSLATMLTVEQTPLDKGRRRIDSGDGSALLIIPKGFSSDFLNERPLKLQLLTNPSQSILPGIIQEITSSLADAGSYLQQFAGDDLRQFTRGQGAPSDAAVAQSSVRISHQIAGIRRYFDPPLIAIDAQVIQTGRARNFNLATAMLPSIMFLAVMFLAFGYGGDVWKEREGGTLRRLAVTPGSLTAFLGGKLLSLAVLFALLTAVAELTGRFLLGSAIGHPALAILWVAVSGSGLYLLLVLVNTLVSSRRAANIVSNLAVMLLAMVGGCFFPFEIMPDFLARIGRLTPNGWALVQFQRILAGEAGAVALVPGFAGMAVAIAALFVATRWGLRRRFLPA